MKVLAEIKFLEQKIAGTVDYDAYMKAHPKSKKQRNDPMFKQKDPSSKAPAKAPAQAKPKSKAPAKAPSHKTPEEAVASIASMGAFRKEFLHETLKKHNISPQSLEAAISGKKVDIEDVMVLLVGNEKGRAQALSKIQKGLSQPPAKKAPAKAPVPAWKSKHPNLSANETKGVEKALSILKRDNNSDLNKALKKFEQGKITKEQLADECENWNWHACAALLRADEDTDVDVISHADGRHNGIDLGEDSEKEQYAGERSHLFDARYEATNPDKRLGLNKKPDSYDMNRHMNALTYLNHHGLHESPTAKRLKSQIESNKDLYKKHFSEMSKQHDENISREKKELQNFKPDPKYRWTKKNQEDYVNILEKAKQKHHELGKALGLH